VSFLLYHKQCMVCYHEGGPRNLNTAVAPNLELLSVLVEMTKNTVCRITHRHLPSGVNIWQPCHRYKQLCPVSVTACINQHNICGSISTFCRLLVLMIIARFKSIFGLDWLVIFLFGRSFVKVLAPGLCFSDNQTSVVFVT